MPVSGLVVTLVSDAGLRESAITDIREEPMIEIGPISGNKMAIVLDTPNEAEDKRLWCWLSSLAGVVFVDVAMVGFEEAETTIQASGNQSPIGEEQTEDGQ